MDTSVSAVSSVIGKLTPSSTLPTSQVMPLPIVGNPEPPPKPVHAPAAEAAPQASHAPAPAWMNAFHAAEASGAVAATSGTAQDATQAPQATAIAQATPFYAESAHDRAEPHPIASV